MYMQLVYFSRIFIMKLPDEISKYLVKCFDSEKNLYNSDETSDYYE